jgi:methionyl-tRNA formyltransferase
VSFAPKISVEDARVDWTEPAIAIDRRVRACTPDPGAWSTFGGERIKLGPVGPVGRERLEPGHVEVTKNAVFVGTATGPVQLGRVTPHGRKEMDAADWARGARLDSPPRLGE